MGSLISATTGNLEYWHPTSGFILGTSAPLLSSPYILETKTRPPSAFVVWEILGLSLLAFGCEISQQGLFVFWISDYNRACQIAFCFMPMHAAISEGKDPLYWEPYDQLWQLKGTNHEWLWVGLGSQHWKPVIIIEQLHDHLDWSRKINWYKKCRGFQKHCFTLYIIVKFSHYYYFL